jgi:hypothetical protein
MAYTYTFLTLSFRGGNIQQSWRIELSNGVLHFWPQWLVVFFIVTAWLLITFLLDVPNCPKGYLGPGGEHDHGKYQNCTGGMWRYHTRNLPRLFQLYEAKISAILISLKSCHRTSVLIVVRSGENVRRIGSSLAAKQHVLVLVLDVWRLSSE